MDEVQIERFDGVLAALRSRADAGATVVLARAPRSAGQWLSVAEASLRGPMQVAVAGEGELVTVARALAPGGAVVVAGEPDSTPLLADRPLRDGAPTAYVCRGFICHTPVSTSAELRDLLAR